MRHLYAVSPTEFDPDGAFTAVLRRQTIQSGRRRQQITATLDGFVTSFDNGFTFAGNEMQFVMPYKAATVASIDHVLQVYPIIYLSTRQGFFRAAPLDWKIDKNEIIFRTKILREIALWQ